MIILHHLNDSRSRRILWLLEELGLPHELRRYERDSKTLFAPPALKQVHSLGKSPIIEEEGRTLVESGAIVEYLVEKAEGQFGAPADRDGALRYRMFLHYAEGSVMPPLLVKLVLRKVPVMGRVAIRRIQPLIDVHLDFIEGEPACRPWFAGEAISAADIMMSFPIEVACERGGLDDSRPHTMAWLKKIQARPAYRRALAAG